jgi:polyisoprenoid-binding protein YceI
MKKIILAIIIIFVVAVAAFLYIGRSVSAPTVDINQVSSKLPAGSATGTTYSISAEKSLVTFSISELLSGKPKLVIGTTTQIAGEIALADGRYEIGTIKINARTFVTDNKSRNGALNRLILKSEDPANEFIVFTPTSNNFTGRTFDVPGNITIAGVTQPIVFKVNITSSGDTLVGTAETRIKRGDFNLVIPNLAFIANVDEEFPVKVDIVAEKIMK